MALVHGLLRPRFWGNGPSIQSISSRGGDPVERYRHPLMLKWRVGGGGEHLVVIVEGNYCGPAQGGEDQPRQQEAAPAPQVDLQDTERLAQ